MQIKENLYSLLRRSICPCPWKIYPFASKFEFRFCCCMQCIYVLFAFHWIVSFISGNKTTCTLSLYLILRLCIVAMYTTRNVKQLDFIHYYSHLLHIQFVVGGNLRIEWFSMSKLQFSFFIFLFNFLDAYRCTFLFIILFAIFNYKFEATHHIVQ